MKVTFQLMTEGNGTGNASGTPPVEDRQCSSCCPRDYHFPSQYDCGDDVGIRDASLDDPSRRPVSPTPSPRLQVSGDGGSLERPASGLEERLQFTATVASSGPGARDFTVRRKCYQHTLAHCPSPVTRTLS